jgi:hypothetical protein
MLERRLNLLGMYNSHRNWGHWLHGTDLLHLWHEDERQNSKVEIRLTEGDFLERNRHEVRLSLLN